MPDGKLSATIIVLVNGQSAVHLDRLDTPLEPEDTVAFFPMIAGG
jgi:molybdopterin converting factor small subunit